jgi:ketosteroid isomerase-like protein
LTFPTEGGARTTMVEIFLVIWKKGDDGDWYLRRDIWNSVA